MSTAGVDRMTIDDVVVRTVGLLLIVAVSGGLAWQLVPDSLIGVAWIGAALVGLGLGLYISFKRVTNPSLIVTYAVVEGIFVGMASKVFESWSSGIVVQAVLATFGIFLTMAALYKFRVIRSSPRFARIITGAVGGIVVVVLGNFVLGLLGVHTGLRGGSGLSIVFSIVILVIAALTFILDFDLIEQSIAQGAPKEVAWTCAFGLLVGLIWVYLEVLRLLGNLRR